MSTSDFTDFARRELPGLLRYAVMLTGDRELAQDLVQDVLVKVHDQWRRVAAADRPDRYVRAMVTRAFLSWRRRWAVRSISLARDGRPEGEPIRDHSVAVVDRDDVWRRLARLPRAPDPDATLAEVTRRLDDRRPARGRLAVVGAAAAVVAVAAGASLLGGDRPADPGRPPAASPTLTAPYPVDTLSVAPGWLPPGEVVPESGSVGYGVESRSYQIARRSGPGLYLAVQTSPGTQLPTRSDLETPARDLTVAGRPAREWSVPLQYYVVVALPQGLLASVSLHGDAGDTAAGLAALGRRVAEQLRVDQPERVDVSYELTALPAGRAVMSVNVTLVHEGVIDGGTSYTVAAPTTTEAQRKQQSIYVRQYNRSWRTMEFRPAPPETTPGRPVQGRPTLVESAGGPTLWIDEIRPGVSIRLSSNAPDVSLEDLYRIADGIRWTG